MDRLQRALTRMIADSIEDGITPATVADALRNHAAALRPEPPPVEIVASDVPLPDKGWGLDTKYLRRKEAAAHLRQQGFRIAPSTLAKLATIGGGPPFQRFGRWPVYTAADLDAWCASRTTRRMASTSDVNDV